MFHRGRAGIIKTATRYIYKACTNTHTHTHTHTHIHIDKRAPTTQPEMSSYQSARSCLGKRSCQELSGATRSSKEYPHERMHPHNSIHLFLIDNSPLPALRPICYLYWCSLAFSRMNRRAHMATIQPRLLCQIRSLLVLRIYYFLTKVTCHTTNCGTGEADGPIDP